MPRNLVTPETLIVPVPTKKADFNCLDIKNKRNSISETSEQSDFYLKFSEKVKIKGSLLKNLLNDF